jgi:hypothetical protein
MTERLLAWHGSQPLKDEVMERLRRHREADEFVQGIYQRLDPQAASGYRGCAIGCTLPPRPAVEWGDSFGIAVEQPQDWHGEVQMLYGIDYWVAYAIDGLFESLPPAACAAFAVDVVDAIPVGADLTEAERWTDRLDRRLDADDVDPPALAAEFIERLRNAPVPTPA